MVPAAVAATTPVAVAVLVDCARVPLLLRTCPFAAAGCTGAAAAGSAAAAAAAKRVQRRRATAYTAVRSTSSCTRLGENAGLPRQGRGRPRVVIVVGVERELRRGGREGVRVIRRTQGMERAHPSPALAHQSHLSAAIEKDRQGVGLERVGGEGTQ